MPTHDPGLIALCLIARYHNMDADAEHLRHRAGLTSQHFSPEDIARSARSLGLRVRKVRVSKKRLAFTPLPALGVDMTGRHFVLAKCELDNVLVVEPLEDAPTVTTVDDVMVRTGGHILLFASRASITGDLARFDFSWFIPAVIKYRRILLGVLSVSVVLQLLGLVSPLMFQVVMDKVLVNRALSTLTVVCVALLASSIFETLLTGLRNYVFAHTANRIDVELGAKLFRHLLGLPLAYFEARRVGDTVARVRELENIRSFLTGQALTAIIDMFFSVILLAVMCLYSLRLTIVVALSLPLYAVISMVVTPMLRTRLDDKFARGADNQSFLVETVAAAETVKAMAVEPQFTRLWDGQLAAYVAASFRVSNIGNVGQQLIQVVGKVVTTATLFFGAEQVISGKMTVGQLVAFNMLSQRVATPVLRLAQLWQDFQQVGVSMQRLGDILNNRTETALSKLALPELKGEIQFEHVDFRYRPEGSLVLKQVSLQINAGQMIGVVGRSGSGKSTLTKLIQRLYLPESGKIRIDGTDLTLADPDWLRRQIGVVLQENILFNRTIRDNIAIADMTAPLGDVLRAAELAGAHDFISDLPEAYDTVIGEHGAGLSGGQRQRIAIARALLTNPRVLILDEATSALDFETERIIQQNMRAISVGRTVIIIAHRLSAVRQADTIYVLDKGSVVEQGRHEELLEEKGLYAHMLSLQVV